MHRYDPARHDPLLFAGTAPYYARYREPYDPVFVELLRNELGLNGTGRLLDLGCGTGNILVPLASSFDEAVGVDPDAAMLSETRRVAEETTLDVRLVQARGEALPFADESFDLITMAAAFHWMDRAAVLDSLYELLLPDGAVAHISNVRPEGDTGGDPAAWPEVRPVIERYLGPERRAGAGLWHDPGDHRPWFTRSRFGDGKTLHARTGHRRQRTVDDVIGVMFSASGTAPHLFGERIEHFAHEVREALLRREPSGIFPYVSSDIEVQVVRKPAH